jgi:hypothetical protein
MSYFMLRPIVYIDQFITDRTLISINYIDFGTIAFSTRFVVCKSAEFIAVRTTMTISISAIVPRKLDTASTAFVNRNSWFIRYCIAIGATVCLNFFWHIRIVRHLCRETSHLCTSIILYVYARIICEY